LGVCHDDFDNALMFFQGYNSQLPQSRN
jgi:hypothetical protein